MKKAQPPIEAATENVEEVVGAEPPAEVAKPVEPTFTASQLRPDARALFGISQSTFDGATHGVDAEQKFTVNAMRDHINKWLKEGY